MDRRARTVCQSREEWGRHAPNRRAKRTSSEDRARTSHWAGRCRVEEQAPVEQGSEWGTVTVVRDQELTGKAVTRNASSGPVKRDCSRGGTENMRLRARQECPAWTWTNRRNDRNIAEPNQRRNLGQTGEWETIPSDGHSGGPQVWAQQRGKMGGRRGMLSGTLRELSAEFAGGRVEVDGNVEVFEGVRHKRVRTRSCVQKGQRSPQEWTDRARHL